MKKLNINSNVKVKLTKFGKEYHKQRHIDFWSGCQGNGFPYVPPKEDADGYCEFQLWRLMEIFGSLCKMACELPFETVILIDDKDLA
jgi:hypothetical protein